MAPFLRVMMSALLVSGGALAAPREKFGHKTEARIDARIYTQPNRYGKAISIVGRGLELNVLRYSSSKSWALIETPSRRRGWIPVRATTIGMRYSAGALAARPGIRTRLPASRGPASDNMNLDDLGYDGSQYENDSQNVDQDLMGDPALAQVVPDLGASNGYDTEPSVESDFEPDEFENATLMEANPDSSAEGDDGQYQDNSVDVSALENDLSKVEGFESIRSAPVRNQPNSRVPAPKVIKSKEASVASQMPGALISLGIGYSNLFNIDHASGFGMMASSSVQITPSFRAGLGLGWDRSASSATNGVELVRRSTNLFRVGALGTLQLDHFGVDLLLGWVRSTVTLRTTENGTPTSEFNGTSGDSAFGLRISPRYDYFINERFAIRGFCAYSLDFFRAGEFGNSGFPQSITAGVGATLGF